MTEDAEFKKRFGMNKEELRARVFNNMCGITDEEAKRRMANFKSRLINCFLHPKDEDRDKILFCQQPDGTVQAGLDGYAIIPMELYEAQQTAVEALRAGAEFFGSCTVIDKHTREQLLPSWRVILDRWDNHQ